MHLWAVRVLCVYAGTFLIFLQFLLRNNLSQSTKEEEASSTCGSKNYTHFYYELHTHWLSLPIEFENSLRSYSEL